MSPDLRARSRSRGRSRSRSRRNEGKKKKKGWENPPNTLVRTERREKDHSMQSKTQNEEKSDAPE